MLAWCGTSYFFKIDHFVLWKAWHFHFPFFILTNHPRKIFRVHVLLWHLPHFEQGARLDKFGIYFWFESIVLFFLLYQTCWLASHFGPQACMAYRRCMAHDCIIHGAHQSTMLAWSMMHDCAVHAWCTELFFFEFSWGIYVSCWKIDIWKSREWSLFVFVDLS